MLNEILEMVRSWHALFQCIFVVALVAVSGVIILVILNFLAQFFNDTLTTWIRGYPPEHLSKNDENSDDDR